MQAKISTTWVMRAANTLPLALFFAASGASASEQNSYAAGLPGSWRAYAAELLINEHAPRHTPMVMGVRGALAREISSWTVTSVDLGGRNNAQLQIRSVFDSSRNKSTRLINESLGGLDERQMVSAWTQRFGSNGEFGINGVFAHQSFSTPGLGASNFSADESRPSWANALESSSGVGLGVTVLQPVSPMLDLRVSMQSKIAMEPFKRFRGVYSDPGKFDLPASAKAGLDVRVSDQHIVGLGIERVQYSAIEPFTSRDLPNRFLSLLGDVGSPEFAWRDLTVYTARWQWQADDLTTLEMRYSTQLQPEPTSELLRDALSTEYTDRNFGLTLARRTGTGGELQFNASYSPFAYFLGPTIYRNALEQGSQLELEAVYRLSF